ncbi:MAG: hydrolase [Rhodospirillales bacterium]|nr:hydrolase [Rhodospirillales bacterium]
MLIQAEQAALLVVDIQSRLLPAMAAPEAVVANTSKLMIAAARLGVPILVSEQYPKGLGPSVPEIAALTPAGAVLEKNAFSCAGDAGIVARVGELGRRQLVLAGIESHVCVLQTAIGFRALGYEIAVAWDATSSRREADRALAADRLRAEDVTLASVEMVLFEWLGRAGTPEFKEISALIK